MTQSSERYLGRYRLDRKIGAGGMGVVYAAHDTVLDRPVAVKIMHDGLGDDETFQARFRHEAETLARVRSRHIVHIHDYGTVDGQTYLVTELLDGGDLRARLDADGPLPPAVAAELTAGVCEGLQDAHDAGVLHRDVKPSNVLLWEREEQLVPYLCDFGIATDGEHRLTRTGGVVGSLAYMAPERHLGEAGDARSDVYATGCLLWTLLTGLPPYIGTDFQVASGHLSGQIPQAGIDNEAGAALDELLRAALAKEPSARIATAGELRDRLRRFVPLAETLPVLSAARSPEPNAVGTRLRSPVAPASGGPDRARPTAPRGPRPRRRLVALVAGLVVLLAGVTAATRVFGDPSGPATAGQPAESASDSGPSSTASAGIGAGSTAHASRKHGDKTATAGAAHKGEKAKRNHKGDPHNGASAQPLTPPGRPGIRAIGVWKGVSFRLTPPSGSNVSLERRVGSDWVTASSQRLVPTGFGQAACITVRARATSGSRQAVGEPVTDCGTSLAPHVTLTRTGTCASTDAEACLIYAVRVSQFPAGRSGLPLTLHEVSTTNGGTDSSRFTLSTDADGRGSTRIRTTSFKKIWITYDGYRSATVGTGTKTGDNSDPGGTRDFP